MSGRVRETSLLLTAMQRYARDGNTLDKGGQWLSTVHERQMKNLPVSGSVNHRPAELSLYDGRPDAAVWEDIGVTQS